MENVYVKEGITKKQIQQLINYTNTDELIQETTKDLERFKSIEHFTTWLKKDRTVFVLTDIKDNLLGILWYGRKTLPNKKYLLPFSIENYGVTFAVRIYKPARGKGLSKLFMDKAFDKYKHLLEYTENKHKGIWLETTKSNLAAIRAYERFGFKIVSNPDTDNRIIMCQF